MGEYCIGVDIGGTSVKLGLFTVGGNLLEKWEIITRKEKEGAFILSDAAKSIQSKLESNKIEKQEITGIGVGVPGPVMADGTVLACANLGWGIFSLLNEVKKLTEIKNVKVANDAKAAALGELWKGGGRGYRSILMVTLGTGVGGGIIIDGEILNGSKGVAGEIGHTTVNFEEEAVCGCGNRGCLEQYTSATGIVRMTKKALKENGKPSILRDSESISAKKVFDAAKQNDELALEILNEFGKYLGSALSNAAKTVDPEAFVIGGGVSRAGDILLEIIKKYYNRYAFNVTKNIDFKLAELGNDAGIYGCAKMVIQ